MTVQPEALVLAEVAYDEAITIDKIGPIIVVPSPCKVIGIACVWPFYWDPIQCMCICKQQVECAPPYVFSFKKCDCMCPQS